MYLLVYIFFFFSRRRRHTRYIGDWSSDVCSSDLFDKYFESERGPKLCEEVLCCSHCWPVSQRWRWPNPGKEGWSMRPATISRRLPRPAIRPAPLPCSRSLPPTKLTSWMGPETPKLPPPSRAAPTVQAILPRLRVPRSWQKSLEPRTAKT